MVAKRSRWKLTEVEGRVPELKSPDEEVRADAIRAFCPCHAGWEAFESHVGEVMRAMRDPSRAVRAHALHIFQDASRMRAAAEMVYCAEEGEERIGEKRAQRFRSIEERLEARRDNRMRRRRRRHGRA